MANSTFKLNPKVATFLTPTPFAVQFMVKGIVAMAAAQYITSVLDYDRPYWSLISAVFLQIRPQSGLVIEKGICQLVGNLMGGALGLIMMACFAQAPPLAFAAMAFIIFILSTLSSMTSNMNVTYLCAMTSIVMVLVVAISLTGTTDSENIFEVAIQRVSEISIGAICATLSSMLLWPQRVHAQITAHANDLFNSALDSMSLYLDPENKAKERHESLLSIIEAVMLLEGDSNPVIYEGPAGLGRARAAHLLTQRTLSLIAEMQVLGHFIREHPDWLNDTVMHVFERLRETVRDVRNEKDPKLRRQHLDKLRKAVNDLELGEEHTALQYRAIQAVSEVLQVITVMDEARRAVGSAGQIKLKAQRISRYHDVLSCAVIGVRSSVMFALGSILWIGTGWSVAFLLMILPVVFSIMFANAPTIPMLKSLIQGMLLSIPVSLALNGLLLASAPSFFEVFLLVFCAPLAIMLFGFTYRPTLPISLGFCLTQIIMTMPSNNMTFDISSALERGIAMVLGVCVLLALFTLIKNPGALIMRRRLISSTANDIALLSLKSGDNALAWLNGRMITRIQRLATFETNAPGQRNLIEQGMLGMNLGHVIIKQAHQLALISKNPDLQEKMKLWQESLAAAYRASAWGMTDDREFLKLSGDIYHMMQSNKNIDELRLKRFEGLCYRIAISLRRNAGVSESQIEQLQKIMTSKGEDPDELDLDIDANPTVDDDLHNQEDTSDGSLPGQSTSRSRGSESNDDEDDNPTPPSSRD